MLHYYTLQSVINTTFTVYEIYDYYKLDHCVI